MLEDLLTSLFGDLITGAVLSGLEKSAMRGSPKWDAKRKAFVLKTSKSAIVFYAILSVLVLWFLGFAYVCNAPSGAIVLGYIFLAWLTLVWIDIAVSRVYINKTGINGPTSLWRPSNRTIQWDEVAKVRYSQFFWAYVIESRDGKRIYVSSTLNGVSALKKNINLPPTDFDN